MRSDGVHDSCHVVDDAPVHVRTGGTLHGFGTRVRIAEPTEPWELFGMPTLEGPVAVRRRGRTSVLYAASHSLTDDDCLGLLDLVGDDPLDPAAWCKQSKPVPASSPGVSGPGHAGVVQEDDDSGRVVHHSHREPGSGWDRRVRTAPYAWGRDGEMLMAPDEVVRPVQRTAEPAEPAAEVERAG